MRAGHSVFYDEFSQARRLDDAAGRKRTLQGTPERGTRRVGQPAAAMSQLERDKDAYERLARKAGSPGSAPTLAH